MHKKYLGIDLGTSNSAVAVFKDTSAEILFNTIGKVNTPSVVRVTEKGLQVGEKAQRNLHKDPQNTFKEFKRLMGTESLTKPDKNGKSWSADELSSEVIKNLKELAEEQEECTFDKVVITVPALFELPQSKATANAARLAGFDKVELLPEPVASGLACGWSDSETDSAWLVYDLGGGTFDASLLESRDGLLRVVAHEGDNFLGGRDIDRAIVEWIKQKISIEYQIDWEGDFDNKQSLIRQLFALAEQAKIRLSNAPKTIIEIDTEINDEEIQLDISFSETQLNELCQPIIKKTIDICLNLLAAQGLSLEHLARVVLVGGPAHMSIIKQQVAEQLAPLAEVNIDPMSLVAQGAAIYSATIGLDCGLLDNNEAQGNKADFQVWLQFPSICAELMPTVMGRIIDDSFQPATIQLCSSESEWKSAQIPVDESGIFLFEAKIKASYKNTFYLIAQDEFNNEIPVVHPSIDIVHGMTMSDPPLSRSIGIALANGYVKQFIDRGTPLPAKRTFTQSTVDTLVPKTDQKLNIPIVQGERRKARFCRNVGKLVIDSHDLQQTLAVGSPVEITIEVDRGGDLKAQAFLPDHNKLIEGVAKLVIEHTSIESLNATVHDLNLKLNNRMQDAFREKDEGLIIRLEPLTQQFNALQSELSKLKDDVDACLRLSRNLMDIEAEFEQIESEDQIHELMNECQNKYFYASDMVHDYGSEVDKKILNDCAKQLEQAFQFKRQGELERLIERFDDVTNSARQKNPEYYVDVFYYWASFIQYATNPRRANKLVDKGHKMIETNNLEKLKPLIDELFQLIPQQYRSEGEETYGSGIF